MISIKIKVNKLPKIKLINQIKLRVQKLLILKINSSKLPKKLFSKIKIKNKIFPKKVGISFKNFLKL